MVATTYATTLKEKLAKTFKKEAPGTVRERLLNTLVETLKIDNEHPDESEITDYIRRRLARAGVPCELDEFGNIIARTEGVGDPILLSTHMDIPEPVPNLGYIIEGDIIKSDGKGILGVDPKSGLAILIELLCELGARKQTAYAPLEVVITRGEEKGLIGARNLDYSLVKAKIGLVLDEDGPVNSVVIAAPACVYVDAAFTGKAAHPREPELGYNALQAATQAFSALPWGFTDEGVMWNIGKFEAGTARNTVPGAAKFHGELRSHDDKLVASEAERIATTLKKEAAQHNVECTVDLIVDTEGYKHEKDVEIIQRLDRTYKNLNIEPNYYSTLGRSDANIFNAHGINTAAIGSGYYNAHQYSEYADLRDMEDIYEFVKEFARVNQQTTI
ncbi:M20/M25/M40 family metallo-hydrolase [soil metagenome]